MKRHTFLQPLSREHHTALTLAKNCGRVAKSGDEAQVKLACQHVILAFSNELEPHFQTEETSLLPLLMNSTEGQALCKRTMSEHRQLRGFLDALGKYDAETLDRFGKCLTAHVRFEERKLFPALESLLPQE